MINDFYYLKIVKCEYGDEAYYEEYFIHPDWDFKVSPMGMKIFDDIEDALDYKEEFFERHKRSLDIKLSEIQVCRL